MKKLQNFFRRKRVCFDLVLLNVTPKLTNEHPISSSKCQVLEEAVLDNGRVVSARELRITCTEQDFITYGTFYKWKSMDIVNLRYYDKGYLPIEFINAILDLYQKKTTLKGNKDEEVNYMISKNMLNSAYGMTVTNPIRDELAYENGEYSVTKPDIFQAIDKYNKNKRRFLYYPWGVWVTAYARRRLFTAIEAVGSDFVYSDTDSVKLLNPQIHAKFFEESNALVTNKIEVASQILRIPAEEYSPLTMKGIRKTIGFWDNEGVYDQFKTLGAKRYLVCVNGDYSLTLAGSNKKSTMEYLLNTGDPFGNFTDDLIVPEDYSGRLTLTYLDDPMEGTLVDYNGVPYHYREESGIHMEKSQYHLTMSDDFINYLLGVQELE